MEMNDDQLAIALRAAIPDGGFTTRIDRRIRAERRRHRLARLMPAAMTAVGVAVASSITSFSGTGVARLGARFADMVVDLSGKQLAPFEPMLSRSGLPSWMLAASAAALAFAFFLNAREERLGCRIY